MIEINTYLDLMRYIQTSKAIIIVIIFCDKYSYEALRKAQTGSEQGVALQSGSVSFPTVRRPDRPQAHSAILPIITPLSMPRVFHQSCISAHDPMMHHLLPLFCANLNQPRSACLDEHFFFFLFSDLSKVHGRFFFFLFFLLFHRHYIWYK